MMKIIVYNMYLRSKKIFQSSIEFKFIAVVSCIKRCLVPKYATLSKSDELFYFTAALDILSQLVKMIFSFKIKVIKNINSVTRKLFLMFCGLQSVTSSWETPYDPKT